jgi:ribosomal-protein-alanine N-acetyltransferase
MRLGGGLIEIRPMVATDIERVIELAAGLEQAPQWPRQVYETMLERAIPERIALVAEELPERVAVGLIVATLAAPEAEVETIAVAISSQRCGVGRRLIEALESALRKGGASEVNLEVRASNVAALAFYRTLGFRESGRRRGYYTEPIEDAVLMRKEVTRI